MESSINTTISFSASSRVMDEEQPAKGVTMAIITISVASMLMFVFMIFATTSAPNYVLYGGVLYKPPFWVDIQIITPCIQKHVKKNA
jgi:hypothetical protein